LPVVMRVVGRGLKAWDEEGAPVVFAHLTGAYWMNGDEGGCPGCRELFGADCAVTRTGCSNRDDRLPEQGSGRPALLEQARMVIVAVASVTVLAALLLAAG
jgi:hypothetical protein